MEAMDLTRITLSLVAILLLIGLCALAVIKSGIARGQMGASNNKRLALIESLALDPRRRAVILRCDDREHLVILGASGETVIQTDLATPNAETGVSEDAQFSRSPFSAVMEKIAAAGTSKPFTNANPFTGKAKTQAPASTVPSSDDNKDTSAA